MVNACGKMSKQIQTATCPPANVEEALEIARGKRHHLVIDAIWGYAQFFFDSESSKILTLCHESGLYEWLRMPFGPASAPAMMQTYVHMRSGSLVDEETGEPFCSPLMDDIMATTSKPMRGT